MQMKIKYSVGMEPIMQAHFGEWYDLRAAADVDFKAGELVFIPLGICVELPARYEAIVRPRSSTSRRYGLVFADSGVIDNAYCGDNDEWGSAWYAVRSGHVDKNARIAQFRIQNIQPHCDIIITSSLGNSDRGGYGSTGK